MIRLGPAFRVDPARSRTVALRDLFIVALLIFVVAPAALYLTGWALGQVGNSIRGLEAPARVMTGVAEIGFMAWTGIPVGMAIGWVACRIGVIGWVAAPILGALGGGLTGWTWIAVQGRAMVPEFWVFPIVLVLPGAGLGILAWVALRWLRPDIFRADSA